MAEKMHSAPTILVETVGLYETNCYYVFPRNDGPLFIIDPGAEPEKLYENTKLFPTKEFVILLTHAHVDHISGAGVLAEKLGVSSVYVPPDDQALYTSPENALPRFCLRRKDFRQPSGRRSLWISRSSGPPVTHPAESATILNL